MKSSLTLPATVHGFENLKLETELYLALGIFDGVHLGHQAVINSAVRAAQGAGGISGVLTFFPHPTRLLTPSNPTRLLQPPRLKSKLLRRFGVQLTIWKKFTKAFATMPAESFLAELKRAMPTLKSLHIGENFRFGQGRAGDVSLLVKLGKPLGISIFSVERLKHNGEPISSSRIRLLLEAGEIAEANELLGYSYFSEGLVQPGQQLARQLGFPTLNLKWEPEFTPRYGVYAAQVSEVGAPTSKPVPAVANYGVRPTVAKDASPVLEVHLLQPAPWTTGARLQVEWLHFLRPEQRFPSLDGLKQQVTTDIKTAQNYFKRE